MNDEIDDYDKQFENIDAEFVITPRVDNDKGILLSHIADLEDEIQVFIMG